MQVCAYPVCVARERARHVSHVCCRLHMVTVVSEQMLSLGFGCNGRICLVALLYGDELRYEGSCLVILPSFAVGSAMCELSRFLDHSVSLHFRVVFSFLRRQATL